MKKNLFLSFILLMFIISLTPNAAAYMIDVINGPEYDQLNGFHWEAEAIVDSDEQTEDTINRIVDSGCSFAILSEYNNTGFVEATIQVDYYIEYAVEGEAYVLDWIIAGVEMGYYLGGLGRLGDHDELSYMGYGGPLSDSSGGFNQDIFPYEIGEVYGSTDYVWLHAASSGPLEFLEDDDSMRIYTYAEVNMRILLPEEVDPAGGGDSQPVPEPATMLLLGSGLVGLAGLSRKKLKK